MSYDGTFVQCMVVLSGLVILSRRFTKEIHFEPEARCGARPLIPADAHVKTAIPTVEILCVPHIELLVVSPRLTIPQ
jgi:hypothetical protein